MIELLKGILLGFLIAIPVGPIGMLCIQRTLAKGRLSGFISGLGAATADGLYSAVAAFGISIVTSFVAREQFWLRLIGGAILLYIGIQAFRKDIEERSPAAVKGFASGASDYLSTFVLTLTNPSTIISFGIFFVALNFNLDTTAAAVLTVAGVAIGSALWWLALSMVVEKLVVKMKLLSLQTVGKCASGIIIITALLVLGSILK